MLFVLLTNEQKLIQSSARALCDKSIRPFVKQWESECAYPRALLTTLGEAGLMGMLIPPTWGGSDIDAISYILVIQEIARACGAISTLVSVQNSVVNLPLLKYGSEDQKQQFLLPLAQGQQLGAFCLTEPEAGSDPKNLKTKAIQKDNHYIINGVKQFVTNGKQADVALVFAKTAENVITAFIIPTKTPGYTVAKCENKMGQHCVETAQIVLDNVKIPLQNRLGGDGDGYNIAMSALVSGRLGIAAQAIGMAREALEVSLSYAKERRTFRKPLCEHQAILFKLADMATQLTAAEQLLYHAVMLHNIKEASMAKLFASEAAENICREAIQIFGGYGYLQDFPVERLYRDVRVTTLYEGTSEIQRIIIGKAITI